MSPLQKVVVSGSPPNSTCIALCVRELLEAGEGGMQLGWECNSVFERVYTAQCTLYATVHSES
jgi:hypothetical protein